MAVTVCLAGLACAHGTPAGERPSSCGTASAHGFSATTTFYDTGNGAVTCFHLAAATCKKASLTVHQMGVDTGANSLVTLVPGRPGAGGCSATVATTPYSANFGGHSGPTTTETCTVAVKPDSVDLSCPDGPRSIPTR